MIELKGLEVPTKPTRPTFNVLNLCIKLMRSELQELEDSLYLDPLEDIAKELSDVLYVVLYTANSCGIDIEPIFNAVHESNLTKKPPTFDEDGKLLKGPNYIKPNLAPLIREQLLGVK